MLRSGGEGWRWFGVFDSQHKENAELSSKKGKWRLTKHGTGHRDFHKPGAQCDRKCLKENKKIPAKQASFPQRNNCKR